MRPVGAAIFLLRKSPLSRCSAWAMFGWRGPLALAGDLPRRPAEHVQQERAHLGVGQLDGPRAQRQTLVLLARAGGEVEGVGQLLRRQPLDRVARVLDVAPHRPRCPSRLQRAELVGPAVQDRPQQVLQVVLVRDEVLRPGRRAVPGCWPGWWRACRRAARPGRGPSCSPRSD